MNTPKLVVVSQRVDVWTERGERRDALDQSLVTWLLEAGYLPVPAPNALAETGALGDFLAAMQPIAIVLSGGNDIGEIPERDHTESDLLAWAAAHHLPVLGICRGMQMMGVWAGSTLKQVPGHVRTRHVLHGQINGEVNSFHNVALAGCPRGFTVLAHSQDGQIEAMRHQSLPWEGWMWHPERETPFASADLRHLRKLVGC